ncbi:ABC transporter permease [Sphingomonas sp. MMS24-JH45]
MREALVVFQFGLAIAFMIGTVVLLSQRHEHVRQTDLGYKREGLVTVLSMRDSLVTPERRRAVADAIRRLPNVRDIAMANDAAGESGEKNSDNVPLPGVAGDGPSLRWIIAGPRFFDTYGARLVAGRLFDDARRDDDSQPRRAPTGSTSSSIAAPSPSSASARSRLRSAGRWGASVRARSSVSSTICASVRHAIPPRRPITFYYREVEKSGTVVATVRHRGDPRATIDQIRGIWRRLVPQVPFDAETADKRLTEFYQADDRATRLFAIGAGLAVLIGCVGLWGLASFDTARRTKEIGIRKTLGASSTDIVKLLVGQFLRPVLVANLVAWPIAWFAMRTWLAGFSDAVALSPLYFMARACWRSSSPC